jgi:hypothetical protein
MGQAYVPGLRVTADAELRRERRLPLKGDVLVEKGAEVAADTVVARTELPGNVQTVNLAAKLSLDPPRVPGSLVAPLGSAVRRGETIAEARGMFGLMTQRVESPADGTLESVSAVTGQLIVRERPIPVEVNAYVPGVVDEVLAGEGVVVRTRGALVQGIFGVGGETFGALAIAVDSPEAELTRDRLREEHRGQVVAGGAYVSHETLMAAKALGVAAVVVGGFDDRDLRELLGRDLGVAITGSEDLGFTLVLTEGFGRIAMADRTWSLFRDHAGLQASVSGATQIRAGVLRPEIVIANRNRGALPAGPQAAGGLDVGSLVRAIRAPHFGRIGRVTSLPTELRELDSGAAVRVLRVRFEHDGSEAEIPRANVEILER